jgi:hypothetical protein
LIVHGPAPTSIQLSWERGDPPSNYLSVIAKRTYNLDAYGRLTLADEQEPLLGLTGDQARDGCVEHDSDIWPGKPLTDVVIQGHLYPSQTTARFVAQAQIGPVTKDLLVTGDRMATLAADGQIVFSRPSAIEKIPLTYAHAYGGIDRVTEEKYGNPMMVFDAYRRPELQPEFHSPFIYPRNAAGRGYLLEASAEAVAALELPNIEDPRDPLTEQRILVGRVKRWPQMPLPWGTQWLHPATFPRVGYAGAARQFEPFEGPWHEVVRGFAEPGFPRLGPTEQVFDPRFTNGGSLGLQLASFTGSVGGIDVRLRGFTPGGGELAFRLPGRPPKLAADGRDGKLVDTTEVLHHVVIRPDQGQVVMVWRGAVEAKRRYLDDELAQMPYSIEWRD